MYERIRDEINDWDQCTFSWSDRKFNSLARQVFAFQFQNNASYRRYCENLNVAPSSIDDYREIPPVPVDVFKHETLTTSDAEDDIVQIFETSGTTSSRKGRHVFERLDCYKASLRAMFSAFFGNRDLQEVVFSVLIPPFEKESTSSLSFMLDELIEAFGHDDGRYFLDDREGLDISGFERHLNELRQQNSPIVIFGTAFAFAEYLDRSRRDWSLPDNTVVIETGGFKGKYSELSRSTYYERLSSRFGLDKADIYSEYSMTELSSQAYRAMTDTGFQTPPWARIDTVDPDTLEVLETGRSTGLIRWTDLANVGSVASIVTSDMGRKTGTGLELLGRASESELRGCSLTAEEIIHQT